MVRQRQISFFFFFNKHQITIKIRYGKVYWHQFACSPFFKLKKKNACSPNTSHHNFYFCVVVGLNEINTLEKVIFFFLCEIIGAYT